MTTAFVSFSGGLDSTATLLEAILRHDKENVIAVSSDYGQRHSVELIAAQRVATALGVQRVTVELTGLLSGSSLLDPDLDVPEGHYAEESMSDTVVNGRNLAFISACVGMSKPGDEIWVGVHGGDHFVYADCRENFIEPLGLAISNAYEVSLVAPFVQSDKTAIAASFAPSNLDIAAMTWSCYVGGEIHCGRCGTCVERAEAFHLAGVDDPTDYEDPNYWKEVVA